MHTTFLMQEATAGKPERSPRRLGRVLAHRQRRCALTPTLASQGPNPLHPLVIASL